MILLFNGQVRMTESKVYRQKETEEVEVGAEFIAEGTIGLLLLKVKPQGVIIEDVEFHPLHIENGPCRHVRV